MLLNGCGYVVTPSVQSEQPSVVPTETPVPTSTPTPLPTETNTPSPTDTPLPTIVKHRPTPTVERSVEWDINPFFEKRIDTEWKGVRIKASILIDESLKDELESIEMFDDLLAEIVARTIFVAWYSQHSSVVWNAYYSSAPGNRWLVYDDNEFYSYMDLWSQAQKSGEEIDWRKVQINNIWANDLSDGKGYYPQPYNFWPMYEGEDVPENVKAMQRFTYAFTGHDASKNLTMVRRAPSTKAVPSGYGKNFSDGEFLFILGRYYNKNEISAGSSKYEVRDHFKEVMYFRFCYCEYLFTFLCNEGYIEDGVFFYDNGMYKSIQYWGIKLNLILD